MKYILLIIPCFLLFDIISAQSCTGGQDPTAGASCFKYRCGTFGNEQECDVGKFFNDTTSTCTSFDNYNKADPNYENCRCSNPKESGFIEDSKNSKNEYLYCDGNGKSNRYTCDNIPANLQKPSYCNVKSQMCTSGTPSPVSGKCNEYKCGAETKTCDKGYEYDDSSKTCIEFDPSKFTNDSERDTCQCLSSQIKGLISNSSNSNNKYLYCLDQGFKRVSCSEISSNEKPSECQTSLCDNGLIPVTDHKNCTQYKCGFDSKINSCPRGTHFSSSSKSCENPTLSLSNDCICNLYQSNIMVLVKISNDRILQCNPADPEEYGVTLKCPSNPLCNCIGKNETTVAISSSEYVFCEKMDTTHSIESYGVDKISCSSGTFFDLDEAKCKACHIEAFEIKAHHCDKSSYLYTTVQKCPYGRYFNEAEGQCV